MIRILMKISMFSGIRTCYSVFILDLVIYLCIQRLWVCLLGFYKLYETTFQERRLCSFYWDIPLLKSMKSVTLSLRGNERRNLNMKKQTRPITPAILLTMYKILNSLDPVDVINLCMFLFAFFLFARNFN